MAKLTKLITLFLPLLSINALQGPFPPVENPTISYWQTPPNPDVADRRSQELPSSVDVVIIGSGMTGAAVAHYLLKNGSQTQPLRVAMIEARQACSGATGRNGGHIRPSSYREYAEVKASVGQEQAAAVTRLRAAHVDAFISAANELDEAGREAAEARPVDSIDAFFTAESYNEAVSLLNTLKQEVPDIGAEWRAWDQKDARRISLMSSTAGILTGTPKVAGALWPYRFVTHTLKALLNAYPTFSLDTHTPVLNVSAISNGTSNQANFEVMTTRGIIKTRHVVYAANAWIPNLVPGLDGKISGRRLSMSAQLGGAGLPKAGEWPDYTGNGSLPSGRAWSMYRDGLDYIVQQPKNGEYMFGGGEGMAGGRDTPANSALDDSIPVEPAVAAYLNGALPTYFGYENWGAERTDFPQPNDTAVFPGRTKRVWSGIEGSSFDGLPIVGKIPTSITRRKVRNASNGVEWISAAYDGEGMCFAWLCGQALGSMMLAGEAGGNKPSLPVWFPTSLEITEERLQRNLSAEGRTPTLGKRFSRMG